MLANVRADLAL